MLIRFVVGNLLSFGPQKEFNMTPYSRLKTLPRHKYQFEEIEVLKLASVYGANGAGKSNLINALKLMKHLVLEGQTSVDVKRLRHKFLPESTPQLMAIEYIEGGEAFYYGVQFLNGRVQTEELYLSGLGKRPDQLIFERTLDDDKNIQLKFPEEAMDEKLELIKTVLVEEFLTTSKLSLSILSKREHPHFKHIKTAISWFGKTLNIIEPDSKPVMLAHLIDSNLEFKKYFEGILSTLSTGINRVSTEKIRLETYFGENEMDTIEEIETQLIDNEDGLLLWANSDGSSLDIVKEDGEIYIKQLRFLHEGSPEDQITFSLNEESDGTIRLIDLVPALYYVLRIPKVVIIDEVERSIHPLMIKELIKKFSLDDETRGQLIFTTHESNLLDQDIFRQDEIWFVEKNQKGASELYPLSDFKPHKTIDIRKGYLNGRYGSIPFLDDLTYLNWQENAASQEPTV